MPSVEEEPMARMRMGWCRDSLPARAGMALCPFRRAEALEHAGALSARAEAPAPKNARLKRTVPEKRAIRDPLPFPWEERPR